MKRKGLLSLLIGLLAFRTASAETRVTLKDHVTPQIKTATKLERVPADERIDLSLTVQLDPKALDQAVADMYGPNAPKTRQYLTSAEFAQKFGLAQKRQKLKEFAKANGLTIDPSADRLDSTSVKVYAGASQVEKTFNIQLHHYRDAQGRIFHAHETEPQVPASVAAYLGSVLGLSNNVIAHPNVRIRSAQTSSTLTAKPAASGVPGSTIGGASGPGGALAPSDIKTIYHLNSSLTGSGQTLALVELDGYIPSDGTGYSAQFGLPSVPVDPVSVDGVTNLCGQFGNQPCNAATFQSEMQASYYGMFEVALDIDMATAIAPGVSHLSLYEAPNSAQGLLDIYTQIASDDKASVISTSWGVYEFELPTAFLRSEYQVFQRMVLQGQTFYAASGDSGSNTVIDPATQPYVTAVGGTSLSGTLQSPVETAWNNSSGASGGGISAVWPLPGYQIGLAGTASQQYRNFPDVALNADPYSGYAVYVGGSWWTAGGTSAAAPLWAAFTTLVNQQRQTAGTYWFGFANPTYYQVGSSSSAYATVFNDITTGSNGSFNAGIGYDNTTGWGSFKGSALLNTMAPISTTLTALIASPFGGQTVSKITPVVGTATGNYQFSHYTLDYGAGPAPTTWTTITNGGVTLNGTLGMFDPTKLTDGIYALRLTVYDTIGHTASDETTVRIQYNTLAQPVIPASSDGATTYKPGTVISIQGSITSPSFQDYRVEWAEGVNPATGWSSAGVSLVNGGNTPIANGTLATWTTPGSATEDYYTIRLLVDGPGFTTTLATLVFLEPALASANWPQVVARQPVLSSSPYPMKTPGSGNLITLPGDQDLWIFQPDGTLKSDVTIPPLSSSNSSPPAVGDFDGLPGDKAMMGGNASLYKITSDGALTPLYTDPSLYTSFAQPSMVDLQGNGQLETLFMTDNIGTGQTAYLHALTPAGTELTTHFPIAVQDSNINQSVNGTRVLAVDLNHTGKKQIFVVHGDSANSFTLKVYNWDGTPYPWPSVSYAGKLARILLAANLDNDGKTEVIMDVSDTSAAFNTIYVFMPDGSIKSGWPVNVAPQYIYAPFMAIGDLNGDGTKELVFSLGSLLHVLKSNGQPYSSFWPHDEGANHYFGPIVIGDANGDGHPDIFVNKDDYVPDAWAPSSLSKSSTTTPAIMMAQRKILPASALAGMPQSVTALYNDFHLMAYQREGTLLKSWRINGTQGNSHAYFQGFALGDFNGDGSLDVAINDLVYNSSAQAFNGVLSIYNLNTPYVAANTSWPMTYHDPQNSASAVPPSTVGDTTPPTAPTNPIFYTPGANSLSLMWTPSTDNVGVAGYRVDLSTDPLFAVYAAGYQDTDVGNSTATLFVSLLPSTTYYARVRAYDASVNISSNSTVAMGMTLVTPPPTLTIDSLANGSLVFGRQQVDVTAARSNLGPVLGPPIQRVDYAVDGQFSGSVTTYPYTYYWDTTLSSNGIHGLQASVFDTSGASSSAGITVNVQNLSLFQDNFNAGSFSAWTVVDDGNSSAPSHWQVVNGALTQTSPIHGSDTTARLGTEAITGDTRWKDYSVSFRMLPTNGDLGILFRRQDNNNYYRFSASSDGSFYLSENIKGVTSILDTVRGAYVPGQWYNVTVDVKSYQLRIFVNGQIVFVSNNGSFSSGGIGLYTYNTTGASFDDVQVFTNSLPDPGPTLNMTISSNAYNTLVYTFNGSAADPNGVTTLSLNFGDGSPVDYPYIPIVSTVAVFNEYHPYPSAGTYTVTLQAQSQNGVISFSTQTVVVTNPAPALNMTISSNAYNTLVYTFNGSAADPNGVTTLSLNFGDGSPVDYPYIPIVSTVAVFNEYHPYPSAGTYTVTLQAQSQNGVISFSTQTVVVTNPAPALNMTISSNAYNTLVYTFNGSAADPNGVTTLSLNFGDGSPVDYPYIPIVSTVAVFNEYHPYPSAGTYTVTLQAQSQNGVISFSTQTVVVTNPAPTLNLIVSSNSFNSLFYTFNGSASDPNGVTTLSLNFGDGSPVDYPFIPIVSTVAVFNESHLYPSSGTYTVTLQAQSQNGVISVSSQTLTVNPTCNQVGSNAFFGCYYDDTGHAPGSFTALKATRTDPAINFTWTGTPPDASLSGALYSVRWQGNFTFNAGTYVFTAGADDGVRLYVDGTLVIDQWHDQVFTAYTANVPLSGGTHLIEVEYYQNQGGAQVQVSWAPTGLSCNQVGSNAFFGCYYDDTGHAPGSFTALKTTRTDPAINFAWTGTPPDASLSGALYSVRWQGNFTFSAGTYAFTAGADDGVRLYVDGTLVIDQWHDQVFTAYTANVPLSGGTHLIEVEYYQNQGAAQVQVSWAPTGLSCNQVGSNAFFGCYYDDTGHAPGSFTALKVTRTDPAINFTWTGTPPDPTLPSALYSVRWQGNFTFSAGTYVFTAGADDGVRLYVDGTLVIDQWHDQVFTAYTANVPLSGGTHLIEVEYYQNQGGAQVQVSWAPTGLSCNQVGSNAFFGCYYDDTGHAPGSFTALKVTRTDPAINFTWTGTPPDASLSGALYSVRWQGNFTFSAGTYAFTAGADDGVRLYVDGTLVIDQWHDQVFTAYTANVPLSGGTHLIEVEYYQNQGGAQVQVSWAPTGLSCNQVGSNAFFGCYYDDTGHAPGSFTALKVTRTDPAINFAWTGTPPDPSLSGALYSVRWQGNFTFNAGTYAFTAGADDGVRLYVDGTLVIDQWHDQVFTAYTANVPLSGGTHLIEVEYYQNQGAAQVQVSWAAAGTNSLPAPAFSPPTEVLTNATLEASYPSGFNATSFVWTLATAENISNVVPITMNTPASPGIFGNGTPVSVPLSRLDLGQTHLTPGRYHVTVKAQLQNGLISPSATADITFMSASNVSQVNVYPNPWKPSLGVSFIQFNPVPDGSTIKIFTVSGHWVKTFSAPNGSGSWDLTNGSGEKVASGIYLYLLTDPQGDKVTGKVVVIR